MKPTERDMERARRLLESIHTFPHEEDVEPIARALAEVRRETWLEAAEVAESHRTHRIDGQIMPPPVRYIVNDLREKAEE